MEAQRPRSPPRYPDMCGRRRMQLEVQIMDREITHLKMVAMFPAFREDNDSADFKFIHVFARIETCDKWTETRNGFTKFGTYDSKAAPLAAAEGRPIGHEAPVHMH